eukprot:12982154-Alexandrium_andersonii.AAC.1
MEEGYERRPGEATAPSANMRAGGGAPGLEQPASEPGRSREHALEVGLEDQDCRIAEGGRELGTSAPLLSAEQHAG